MRKLSTRETFLLAFMMLMYARVVMLASIYEAELKSRKRQIESQTIHDQGITAQIEQMLLTLWSDTASAVILFKEDGATNKALKIFRQHWGLSIRRLAMQSLHECQKQRVEGLTIAAAMCSFNQRSLSMDIKMFFEERRAAKHLERISRMPTPYAM